MHGFSNLYHAINDVRAGEGAQIFSVLCSHKNTNFIGFNVADFCEIEPVKDDDFLIFCQEMIKKYEISVIFATHRLTLLGENKHIFERLGIALITCADPKMIDIINDKTKLYDLLANQTIVNIPGYVKFSDRSGFDVAYQSLSQRYSELCMKPIQGIYGEGFYRLQVSETGLDPTQTDIDIKNDLKKLLGRSTFIRVARFRSYLPESDFYPMMMMQYLEGSERSVDCIAVNGKLIAGIIRKKPLFNGPQLIEHNDNIMKQVEYLTTRFNLHGMFNVQFKDAANPDDSNAEMIHYLLEINPRLSGGSHYATLAGLNIPYLAACIFSGIVNETESTKFIPTIKTNSLMYAVEFPMIK